MTDTARQLEALFHEVGEAHHPAYIEKDGSDPVWPQWYADYPSSKIAVCGLQSGTKTGTTGEFFNRLLPSTHSGFQALGKWPTPPPRRARTV